MSKKTLKVHVIGTRGIPATYGGVEKHCEEIYSRMVDNDTEVLIYTRDHYADKNIQDYKGIKLKPLKTYDIKGLEAFYHSMISALIATFSDADIIHFHAQGPCLFSIIPKFFLSKKKIVFTCHGIDWQRDKWNQIGKLIIKAGEWASAKCTDKQITVSDYLADHYREKYNLSPQTIYNGVTINAPINLSEDLGNRFGIEQNKYFVFVGRLVPEKAPEIMIEAFKKCSTDHKLVIVGGSAGTDCYVSHLKELAKDDPRIIFTSYLYGDDLTQVVSSASAYISASKLEGLPLTLLEAMSYAKPVLISDIGPHQEVYNLDTSIGLMFKKNNIEDCTEKINTFLSLDENHLEKMSNHSLKLVQNHFTWEHATSKTLEIFKQSINE